MALVAHYKLEGNDANITPTDITYVTGKIQKASSFNGTTSQIVIPINNIPSKWTDTFSYALWVYIPSSAVWANSYIGNILGKGGYSGSIGLVRTTVNNQVGFFLRGDNTYKLITGNITRDTWYHLVGTWDGSTLKLYINGILVASNTFMFTGIPDIANLNLGGSIGFSGSAGNYYTGYMDDVKIYDHALFPAEIYELSKAKILHYKFDEQSTLIDRSGQEINTALTGANAPINTDNKFGLYAKSYDGSSKYTAIDISLLGDPIFTVMGWFRRTATFTNGGPWGIGAGGINNQTISAYTNTSNKIGIDLWGQSTYHTNVDYPLNEWVHVAWVKKSSGFSTSSIDIYINGVKAPSLVVSRNNSSTVDLTAGACLGRIGYNFNGYYAPIDIGEFQILATALTDSEVLNNYQKRMSIDSVGNVYIKDINQVSSTKLVPNYSSWTPGESPANSEIAVYGSWNRCVLAIDPFGKNIPLWEAYSINGSSAGGGIYVNAIPIDNTKLYRMSFWERRVTNSTATYGMYYFGLNGYGSTNGVWALGSTSYNTNPYFYYTQYNAAWLQSGNWHLVVAHVWPYTYESTNKHNDSGIYDTSGTKILTVSDFRWTPNTTTGRSRTLMVYQPNAEGVLHHACYPRIDICDGTEPSIQDLLEGIDSRAYELNKASNGLGTAPLSINTQCSVNNISECSVTNGLLHWYPLQNNTIDLSNRNDGINSNATSDIRGYLFNGDTSYIELSKTLGSFFSNDFTISMWCYFLDDTRGILFGDYGLVNSIGVNFEKTIDRKLCLYWNASPDIYTNANAFVLNTWHHISVSKTASQVLFYVDGEIVYTYNGVMSNLTTTGLHRLGRDSRTGTTALYGNLSDVRLYNRCLSNEEIRILYNINTNVKMTSNMIYVKGKING